MGLIFRRGDKITFNFLGGLYTGTVINPNVADNVILVDYNGTIHRVGLTEKDNKYCFLHKNE